MAAHGGVRSCQRPPSIALRPGASRIVCATTVARQILTAAETVPTPPWSTACRLSAASRHRRYERDGDARGCPRGTAACWGSSPTANGGRSGTCTPLLARLLPGACPTSALNPSSRRSYPSRFRDLRGPHPSGPHLEPAITVDRLSLQYCHANRADACIHGTKGSVVDTSDGVICVRVLARSTRQIWLGRGNIRQGASFGADSY